MPLKLNPEEEWSSEFPKREEVFDYFIEVKDVDSGSYMAQVVVVQLLAYYMALELGLDADSPKSGQKRNRKVNYRTHKITSHVIQLPEHDIVRDKYRSASAV